MIIFKNFHKDWTLFYEKLSMTSVMSDNVPDNMQCTAYPALRNCNWLDLKVNKYHAKKKTEKRNGMSFTWWAGDTIMAWLSGRKLASVLIWVG